MPPHAVIDLHCDTLTDMARSGRADTLDDPAKALSLSALPENVRWAQCFAIFIPDGLRGRQILQEFAVAAVAVPFAENGAHLVAGAAGGGPFRRTFFSRHCSARPR